MDGNFYDDLNRLGQRYGANFASGLEQVFHVSKKLNNATKNQGIETSASSHVMEYYSAKTVRRVLEYMAIDYVLLGIPIPEWAEQMLLEEDSEGHA